MQAGEQLVRVNQDTRLNFETAALALGIVLRKGPKRPLREKLTLMQCQSEWDIEK